MKALPAGLFALALAGCAGAVETADQTSLPPGAHYVAMGSSFAAGAGIGPLEPGTPERCARNVNNYANLLAEKLDLSLDDQSCSGATSAHLLGPWEELPAQIDAVTPDTRLVTVTVGGNDLNYVGNLFAASCEQSGSQQGPNDEPRRCNEQTSPSEADYASAEASLREIAQAVRERAPEATLVFVQYVRLMPEQSCAETPIAEPALEEARAIGERLARITADAAAAEGALVLPLDTLSASHAPCSAQPWANGFPGDYAPGDGAPWHPNAAGHAAAADLLAELLSG